MVVRMLIRILPLNLVCGLVPNLKYTRKEIQVIEDWINNYPRKILDFETPEERFIREVVA